jgi:hypothetical protein
MQCNETASYTLRSKREVRWALVDGCLIVEGGLLLQYDVTKLCIGKA